MILCILKKFHKKLAIGAAVFVSIMHRIVCRLGLRPRPHRERGSLQRSFRPQFIVIVLEVAVIYICPPRKLLLVKN